MRAGSGSILFLSGEPGIGKSRFLGELRRLATGPLWLEGRCVSYGESMPYWPFRDLLREWLGLALDDPELRTRLSLRRRLNGFRRRPGRRLLPVPRAPPRPAARARDERAPRRALAGGAPVPHLRGRAASARAAGLDRPGRARARGRPLGRSDLAAAGRAAARPDRGGRRPARDHAAPRSRPCVVGAARDRRAALAASARAPSSSRRCRATPSASCVHSLVGADTLPADLEALPARPRRGQPVLPRGARPLARRLGRAPPRRGALALRPRGRRRGSADGREGDPRAGRPS